MYRPDYDFGKRRRSSLLGPMILLGLLIGVIFGVIAGILPIGQFGDWWSWTPVSAHPPIAATAATVAQSELESAAVSPVPKNAALSRITPIFAPEFVLPDLFNDSLSHGLLDYTGQPVILNFWASWCVPCKEEMPALQRIFEKYSDAGLVVLGVNQSFVDGLDAAREFVNELALTFPNVRDDDGNTSEGLYQIMGLPTSVFITPDGEIAHRQIGQMTDEQIEKFSQQLISGEPIGP